MSNPAAGYSNVHERCAVRISNNGEFIHANPASVGRPGQHQRHQRLHQPVDRRRRSSTSTARSTATRSRSPAPRSTCPTPTATSGTGRCTGTSGRRCRRCHRTQPPSQTSRAPRPRRPPTRRRCRARPTTTPPESATRGYRYRVLAVELARRGGLIARPDARSDPGRRATAGRDESDHLGDVLGHQRRDALVDLRRRAPRRRRTGRSENSVSTMPGAISVSRTGFPSSSPRSVRCSAPWACLAAV